MTKQNTFTPGLTPIINFRGWTQRAQVEELHRQFKALEVIEGDALLKETFGATARWFESKLTIFEDTDPDDWGYIGTDEEERLMAVATFQNYFNHASWLGATVRRGVSNGEYVVESGSILNQLAPSCTQHIVDKRRAMEQSGEIVAGKLLVDVTFSSITAAATFIAGYPVNGNKTPLRKL